MSRKIKKYANRKLYDTIEKKYVSLDELSELIKAGEEVKIEDNETGEDLTSSIVSQLLAREKTEGDEISDILIGLLRKGKGTVSGYAKKYSALLQNTLTMAEDEIDKLPGTLVKNKEITEAEAGRFKKEMLEYAGNTKKWIGNKIDQQISDTLGKMNLATKEQVTMLTAKIDSLTQAVERLEKKSEEG
ncbi:polyhydroxyalkanoate synthesis regulator DNA-binding domain-containing protein [Desulfobacterales bacterium HSG2]|nr:polyhydroxyalkanoate synthesis regulator DNA-binding domain-containing protein [Desulfobacterales bacterium HSG2]